MSTRPDSEKVDMLALLLTGGRLSGEKSYAREQRYYGDPSQFVKFRGETMQGTKEIENLLRFELDNWIRWGRKRDWLPVSFKCPIGFMYKSSDVYQADYRPLPIDERQAVGLERIVVALPEVHRKAFVMYQLGRAHVRGVVRITKGYEENARLLGVAKSRYYELVREAHAMVLRAMLTQQKK